MWKAVYQFWNYEWLEEVFGTFEEAEIQRQKWVDEYGEEEGTRSYVCACK